MSHRGCDRHADAKGVFAVEGVNTALLILFVGVPIGAAAVWIAGFIVSALASPVIAFYEERTHFKGHRPAHA